ncbi:MAG: UDP-2,4-diacetamido-2,4,6-trideoxy-beta-L-altropyranose hydrolase [Betaproteobacteria bacterium]
MKVAFRADASLQIGTGHVMRCLTLADALAARGADCQFICGAHEGNLIEFIRGKGYVAHALPIAHEASTGSTAPGPVASPPDLDHAHWLGATQAQDAEACAPILAAQRPDWLIVDHYSLDARWERALAPLYRKLMVIDDLADRPHACDLLLDQTFGRDAADYRLLVPADCRLLCGSHYALLRPEFAALRPYSMQRRAQPTLRELLITMGGFDKDNATGQVLQALRACPLPADCRITVVMGATAPLLEEVRTQAQDMPWPTRVLAGVSDMAQLMADSDLAIGAAGATSWERCCLGLPTAMMVLAENQRHAARLLEQANAVRMLDLTADLQKRLAEFISEVFTSETCVAQLRDSASKVTDGKGCEHVADLLTRKERE